MLGDGADKVEYMMNREARKNGVRTQKFQSVRARVTDSIDASWSAAAVSASRRGTHSVRKLGSNHLQFVDYSNTGGSRSNFSSKDDDGNVFIVPPLISREGVVGASIFDSY